MTAPVFPQAVPSMAAEGAAPPSVPRPADAAARATAARLRGLAGIGYRKRLA